MKRHHLIASLLILLHLLLASAYSSLNPLGEAPDETDHWSYVIYLMREHKLPEGPRVTQSKHPPFYHATAAAIAGLGIENLATMRFDLMRANPDVAIDPGPTQSANFFIHTTQEAWPWREVALAFHLARLWSVLLSTATVAALFGLARSAFPARPGVALLATGLAAALPEFAFIGSAVNNDSAAALLGTLALWGGFAIYQGRGRWQAGWWTPLAVGLGLLAKVSTLSLWPVVALCILLGPARPSQDEGNSWRAGQQRLLQGWPRWLVSGLVAFVPAIAIASPWLIRNWRLYGDPSGMALVRQTIDLRTTAWTAQDTLWLLRGWFFSFWGKFGAVGQLPYPAWIYWLLAAITLLGLVGIMIAWQRAAQERVAIVLLAMAALAVAFAMWRYSLIALGTDQGRLLFPAIGPLLVLLAVGLASWLPPKARAGVGSALVIGLAFLAIYGLVGVIRPAFAPLPVPTDAEVAQASADDSPVSLGELTLWGWSLEKNPILYWQAPQQPSQDWRAALRVTAEDGALVWEWRRSPGYGRYSSDRWPAGSTVRDEYMVQWPDWAGPGRYRVEATIYPFDGKPGEVIPYAMLGWLEKQ